MAKRIPVSFKEIEKDLYEYTEAKLSPSIYIKQLIKNDMEKEKRTKQPEKNKV